MPLSASREVERPRGHSISYSQLAKDCDLALRWQREHVTRSNLGIFLVYGSAFHHGIETYMRGVARNNEEAVRAAIGYLDREIRDPRREKLPLQWDDEPALNQDGSISKARSNYGKLWSREVAVWWLNQQVPLWLDRYAGTLKIERSEHQIFVPITPKAHWKNSWSFEAKLDLECTDAEGDLIVDGKTGGEPWDANDLRKYMIQAHLYMAAYRWHYKRTPRFVFHSLPRSWDQDSPTGAAQRVDEHWIEYDAKRAQLYVDTMVKPKIDLIEAGAYVANPGSRLCTARFCTYHSHCVWGTGKASA